MTDKKSKIICKDINGKEYGVGEEKLTFRPSVYGILIEGDKVLLSPKWDGYDFPGGGVKIGETLDEALRREFAEESGLQIRRKDIIQCESAFFKNPFEEKFYNSIVMYFLCEKIGGKITTENFDEYEKQYAGMPEWIEINKVNKLKFYDPTDCPTSIRKAKRIYDKLNKK